MDTARERWRVASADLARILRLEPTALVEPLEAPHLRVTLVALVQQNLITPEEAIGHATEIEEIRTMLGQPRLGRAAG